MVVLVASDTSPETTRVMGIEVESGRTRWINPPANPLAAFYPLAGLQFEASGPWFHAALPDGNVIRLNALTGHEQRRFRADSRRPEQQKAGPPNPRSLAAATFSGDGRTMVSSERRMALRVGRRIRDVAPEVPPAAPVGLQHHARPRRPHACDLSLAL